MNSTVGYMKTDGTSTIITKYEVMEALFRTEDEENVKMANELNRLFNTFYEKERLTRRNITELPFDIDTFRTAIDYIKKSAVC